MKRIYTSIYLIFVASTIWLVHSAYGQSPAKVGTGAIDGKGLYQEFCAACHGRDGHGNGPAAASLKTPAGDLTLIAKQSGGRFPDNKVLAILNGDTPAGAHGSREMPIWGKTFNEMSSNLSVAQGRKHALVSYLESIQVK